jgi:outer membrane beta-barrel protein
MNFLRKSWGAKIVIGLSLMSGLASAQGEVIRFPEDELALESVLPKFDHPVSVKNRNVVTADRFEVGLYFGFNVLEPILNTAKYGLNAIYHWNEDRAFSLHYAGWADGLNSQYTNGLEKQGLDFNRSPQLKYSLYAFQEWKAFYGKISLTKQNVMNTHLIPLLGLGMTAYEHKNYPGIAGGVAQKFYFTRDFALRFDFKLQYSQYPSPFLGGRMAKNGPNAPLPTEFKDKWTFSNHLELGVTYLF